MEFVTLDNIGAKFIILKDKLFKCLELPNSAKQNLGFPPDLYDKIMAGEPLWTEKVREKDPDDSDEGFADSVD